MNTNQFAKLINFYARYTPSYTKIGHYARRIKWPTHKRDFTGQTWLITGASQGIGRAAALAAVRAGARAIVVSRNAAKLQSIASEFPDALQDRVVVMTADFTLLRSVADLLDKLSASGEKVDVLINNVGRLFADMRLTEEGREATFVMNILSHFQLTETMFERGLFNDNPVIVNMSSGGMYNVPLGIELLNVTDAETYNGKTAYCFAKRAQVALTGYWNKAHESHGLKSYAMHPGWAKTPGVKKSLPTFYKIQNLILRTPLQGADTALWLCATRPEPSSEDVIYFDRKARDPHIFESTRTPQCTVEELAQYLKDELNRDTAGDADAQAAGGV